MSSAGSSFGPIDIFLVDVNWACLRPPYSEKMRKTFRISDTCVNVHPRLGIWGKNFCHNPSYFGVGYY